MSTSEGSSSYSVLEGETSPQSASSPRATIPSATTIPSLRPVTSPWSEVGGDVANLMMMIGADVIAILVAFRVAYWLRFETAFIAHGFPSIAQDAAAWHYWIGAILITSLLVVVMGNRDMYGTRRNTSLSEELINVAKAVSLGMVLVLAAMFFYRNALYSRLVFSIFWVLSIVTVYMGRAAVISLERRHYRAGRQLQRTIIVGNGAIANDVYRELDGHESFGIRVQGYFADADAPGDSQLSASKRLGTVLHADRYIRDNDIQLVLVAVSSDKHEEVASIIRKCEGTNVEFLMVPDFLDRLASRVNVKELGRIPFLALKSKPLSVWNRVIKRLFDVVVSAVLLVLFAPLLVLLAALVRVTSPGPILFAQRRQGLLGQEFTMYKFRSMRDGSEKMDKEASTGIKNDPRQTPLGKFLRRTSLDELPQLFNVLRGDMSLVGPRPERTHVIDQFKDRVPQYLDRHRVKCGITGWAQVNGSRGDTSIDERTKYDLYYIENWSPGLDFRILLHTVRAMIQH